MIHANVIALSISGGVKTLGAYAGLAAVVVLALLILLYFAQAREVKRLREDLLRELSRPRPPAPLVPAAQVRPPAVAPGAPAPIPVGAPVPVPAQVATTVEGVRRVPLPVGATGDTTAVKPPGESASPDATTVSEVPAPPAPPPIEEPPAPAPGATEVKLPPAPPAPAPEPAATEVKLPPAPPPPAPEPEPARLIAQRAPGLEPGSAHEIGEGVMIGRGKAAGLRLTDPLASGKHASIAPDGQQIVLTDLGSTNGTFLNGVLISAPAPLAPGDHIRLGESEFLFDAPAGAGPNGDVGPAPRPAAVPLMAVPAPEQSLELPDVEEEPVAVPLPHPDSPLVVPEDSTDSPPRITRRRRGRETGEEQAARPARRLRGSGTELPSIEAGRRRLMLLIGLLVVAIVAGVVLAIGGGGGGKTPPASGSGGQQTTGSTPAAPPARSSIVVSVLNATQTAHLASTGENQLVADGFHKGAIGNAGVTLPYSQVAYKGKGNLAAAKEVAAALGLPSSSLHRGMTATEAKSASAGGVTPLVVAILGVDYHHS